MGHKQKLQLKRARASEHLAWREYEALSKRYHELDNMLKESDKVRNEYAKRLERPAMVYAIPREYAGRGNTLKYSFYMDETTLAYMPELSRREHFRMHCERALKELNEKYPPPGLSAVARVEGER